MSDDLPTLIDTQLRPEILHAGDPRFDGWEAQSRRQSGDIERRNPHVIPTP
jgi:hypothetical protein